MSDMSKVRELPEKVRDQLDQRLASTGFRGYRELERWLADAGFEIGKSSLQRYGRRLEQRLAAVQASTHAARAIASAAPDEADQRSAAVISLVQTELFNTLVGLQELTDEEDPAKRLKALSQVAKGVSDLTRASVTQKKWNDLIVARAQAAAKTADSIARKGGLSETAAAAIRRAILGIAATEAAT